MSTAELKSNLHYLIDKAKDSKLLKIVYLLLSENKKTGEDWWDSISENEKASIEKGLMDIKKRKVIPHERLIKMLKAEFPEAFK